MASSTVARYARALNDIQLVLKHDSEKLTNWDRDLLTSIAEIIRSGKYPTERQMAALHVVLKDIMQQAIAEDEQSKNPPH